MEHWIDHANIRNYHDVQRYLIRLSGTLVCRCGLGWALGMAADTTTRCYITLLPERPYDKQFGGCVPQLKDYLWEVVRIYPGSVTMREFGSVLNRMCDRGRLI
jgi:hypothetical protein